MEHLSSSLRVQFAQHSSAGKKADNQDTIGARIPEGALLTHKGIAMVVADGVSSSMAAKQASQAAVTGFLADYYATPETWRTQTSASRVIQALNRHLWALSRNSVRQEGHLTTFSALILKGDTGFTFHAGDSRIYRVRNGLLERLTRDHSQRVDRNTTYLTRALGADPALEIDMDSFELEAGDLFLLTTDGIHDVLKDAELLSHIEAWCENCERLSHHLIDAALLRGSQDNLSVQICRVDSKGTICQEDSIRALAQLPFPPVLDVGQSLDGLTVKQILHESERSQIYKVETEDGRLLAMKTPAPRYLDDPAYIERFVQESWIGSRINSPHVVRVAETTRARSYLYYLTEYISGPTLAELIRQRAPFAIADTLEIVEQIIRGTRAMHRRETLHQDLKPANIVMGKNGAVIVDFGSCAVAGLAEVKAPFVRDKVLGTLEYSAPEHRSGDKPGQAADQFSLGVMVYEMLTGKKPYGDRYAATTDPKTFQTLSYIPATRINPLVPVWLDKAIEKSVSLSPLRRYEALSEWLTDLQRPNPNWLSLREQPWIERDPLRFWKACAAVGWLLTLVLLFMLLGGK
jgi:protein phosphatase